MIYCENEIDLEDIKVIHETNSYDPDFKIAWAVFSTKGVEITEQGGLEFDNALLAEVKQRKNRLNDFCKQFNCPLILTMRKDKFENEMIKRNRAMIYILDHFDKNWSKSPYSNSSFYSDTNIQWGYKPEGSLRISDHWNFESDDGRIHAQTDNPDFKEGWAVAIYHQGSYTVINKFEKEEEKIKLDKYEQDLQDLITKEIDEAGGPNEWGLNNYKEVVQKEIAAAGNAREYAQSGTFPFTYQEIDQFMKKHELPADTDKYFNDLAKALENYQEPKKAEELAQEVTDGDGKLLTKDTYREMKEQQNQAFSSEADLKDYFKKVGQIPNTDKQRFNSKQLGLIVAEGLEHEQPVLASTLEEHYISYKGAKAIGALPVTEKKGENFETHIEPVFRLQDLGRAAVAKLNQGTVRDYTRFSHDEKKEIMQNYYRQEGKHKTFKATGDPEKDFQIAKNRVADYLAKRQLGVWGKESTPSFTGLNLEKVTSLTKAGISNFMSDTVKASKIITNDAKKQLLSNEKQRAKARAQQYNQSQTMKPNKAQSMER